MRMIGMLLVLATMAGFLPAPPTPEVPEIAADTATTAIGLLAGILMVVVLRNASTVTIAERGALENLGEYGVRAATFRYWARNV